MACFKGYCTKFVFFLFCLSQVQGGSRLLPEKSDNAYDELFKETMLSIERISEKVQYRMKEAGVSFNKFEGDYAELKKTFIDNYNAAIHNVVEFPNELLYRFVEEFKTSHPEIGEKFKKLNADVNDLNEETVKVLSERLKEIKEEVVTKTKPIAKRLIRIVKDIEEIILSIIPENKKEFKKI